MREDTYGVQKNLQDLLTRMEKEVMKRDERVTRVVTRALGAGRLYLDVYLRPVECSEFSLPVSLSSRTLQCGDVSTLVSNILWATDHAARVQLVTPLEYRHSFPVTA